MSKRLGHDWSIEKKAEAWDNEMMGVRRMRELLTEQATDLLELRGELYLAKQEVARLRDQLEVNNG